MCFLSFVILLCIIISLGVTHFLSDKMTNKNPFSTYLIGDFNKNNNNQAWDPDGEKDLTPSPLRQSPDNAL